MGKPQQGGNKQKGFKGKAKAIKEGQVHKNKQPKFKQTPTGKVPIINGNKNKNLQSPVQANKKLLSTNRAAKPSPVKNPSPQKKNQKQQKQMKKKQIKKVVDKKDDDSETSDINEGISIKEEVSIQGDEESDDSSSEEATPDIFGQSFADDSDEDDEDFEDDDDDDEQEEGKVMKGVKMFKGIKKESVNEDDDDDDDDEEDDDDELEKSGTSMDSSMTEDSDEDDDDDDDSEDDSKDAPGLAALLGESLVDDENDEDFEEDSEDDEDDDISDDAAESVDLNQSVTSSIKSSNGEKVLLSEDEKAEQDRRTIYVGNVPMAVEEQKLKAIFKGFGPIDSIRIRGIIPDSPKTPLKVAKITKKYHAKATAKCAFIVYKSEEAVDKALAMNGKQLDGNYLRVDRANAERTIDAKKAIFLGNLPFDLEDNELWEMFNKCGKVFYIRTLRDRMTGGCRGIGYVNFVDEDSVALALNLNGATLRSRQIRVDRYKPPTDKKPKHNGAKKRSIGKDARNSPAKKAKNNVEVATKNSVNASRRKESKVKRSQGQQKRSNSTEGKQQGNGSFQGEKADNKKKFKKATNTFEKKKQTMAKKLTAKPKKPIV